MITLADAILVAGGSKGRVACEVNVNVTGLTAEQKTSLYAFITSLGAKWPGASSNVFGISVNRRSMDPGAMDCSVRGVVLYQDAPAAVTMQTAGTITGIIGMI